MKNLIILITLCGVVLFFNAVAYSENPALATLNVSAVVEEVCTVSTTPLDFGTWQQGSGAQGTGTVLVTCTPGVDYNIALGPGDNSEVGVFRYISDGTNDINYGIYKDASYTQEWGDLDFGNTFTGASGDASPVPDTGNGSEQSHTAYGRIGGSGNFPAGTYVDAVDVSVSY